VSNQAWCLAAAIATDLLCWLRLLCLNRSLTDAEPKTLRYRLLHTAARIVRGQRKRKIRIPQTWPWADELVAAFPRRVRPGHAYLTGAPTPPSLTRGTRRAVEPAPPTRPSPARARLSTETKIRNGRPRSPNAKRRPNPATR
jgi:hypothetical protein